MGGSENRATFMARERGMCDQEDAFSGLRVDSVDSDKFTIVVDGEFRLS